jgi:hypothetical protein
MRHRFHKIFQVRSTLFFCNFLGTTLSKMLHCPMDKMCHNIFFKIQVLQIISGFAPTLCNEAWTEAASCSQTANDCIQSVDILRRILVQIRYG